MIELMMDKRLTIVRKRLMMGTTLVPVVNPNIPPRGLCCRGTSHINSKSFATYLPAKRSVIHLKERRCIKSRQCSLRMWLCGPLLIEPQ